MITEDVHPNNGPVELWIGALRDVVIQMFLISQSIHALEHEFKESLQVLRTGARDKNVRVPVVECSSDSKPQSSRLSSSSCSGESNCRGKCFLGDCIDKGENSLGLVESLGKFDELPDGFCVNERFPQTGELRLLLRLSGFVFQGFDVLPTRDGENIKFVIEDEAIITRAKGEYESFVEPCDDLVMSRSPVSCMNVLRDWSECLCGGSKRTQTIVMV